MRIFLIASFLFFSACGQATKITKYESNISDGPSFAFMQEGYDENKLRNAMLIKGLNVFAFHRESRGFHAEGPSEVSPDFFIKFSYRLNRPCIAPGSLLIYGKAEIIDSKTKRSILSIEELGFNDSCLGSKAFYGDVYEKLASSIKGIQNEISKK